MTSSMVWRKIPDTRWKGLRLEEEIPFVFLDYEVKLDYLVVVYSHNDIVCTFLHSWKLPATVVLLSRSKSVLEILQAGLLSSIEIHKADYAKRPHARTRNLHISTSGNELGIAPSYLGG
jgi:hypothetical protein